jgi:hypothetical protein
LTVWKPTLGKLFDSETLSDVVVSCEDKKFPAHRFILCSKFFVFYSEISISVVMFFMKIGNTVKIY